MAPAAGGGAGPRVWVDAQLPPALARWLAGEFGVDARHVDEAGLLGAADPAIFAAARAGGADVVVTKDDDFVRLLDQHGPPPQVVWVTLGNLRNAARAVPPGLAAGRRAARGGRATRRGRVNRRGPGAGV